MFKRSGKQTSGFTLVELLVVIGIIALLISILLPALNKVKEASRAVKCGSGMRQLMAATLMYAHDYDSHFPARAGQGTTDKEGYYAGNDPTAFWGWIAWRRVKDPVTGITNSANTPNTNLDQNITCSALAKYMGFKAYRHTTPDEANSASDKLDSIYRCPSDKIDRRYAYGAISPPGDNNGGRGVYRYSYSLNVLFGNKMYKESNPNILFAAPHITIRLNKIKNTSEKIVYLEEDEISINNGEYNPLADEASADDPNKDYSAIAARHEMKFKHNAQDARGNVAFADGHVEFLSRRLARQRRYFDPLY